MPIRKREWKSPNGEGKEAWVVDYVDAGGKRRLKRFKRKRDADAYHVTIAGELRAGTHPADRASTTVAKAGELWLAACEHRVSAQLESRRRGDHYAGRGLSPKLASRSAPKWFGPSVPFVQNQMSRMIHPTSGTRSSSTHQPLRSRS
jgi:hypothetical protein